MAEYAKLVVAVDSTQVKTAERDLQSLGVQSRQIESAVVSMAAKAAAAFGGIKLGGLIKDVTMANSRFEQLGLVMGVVGRNAGLSSEQVTKYAKDVQAMGISMTESRQTVIRMTQAQMDLSKASDLARLAQDAAVIANTNSSDALGRLIYGLQSGQVEILRNMGLNVNFAGSYSKLAAEIGVTTDQLSEVDKVQARTNAVMEAGSQIAGAYDASTENAGKQLGSTTRYLQDLGVVWGSVFSKAASDAIFGYSDALKSIHSMSQSLQESGTLDRLADAIATISRGVVTGAKVLGAYAVAVYAIPAAKAAATVATTAYQAVLATFSAQVAMTTTQLLTMRNALNVLAAGFAGWQIGTYLRNEFEIVEKAGIALMGGLHTMTIRIGGFFSVMGENIKFAVMNPLDAIRGAIADMLEWVSGLGQTALNFLGFEGLAEGVKTEFAGIRGATAAEHKATLGQIRKDTDTQIGLVGDIYAGMFADVGKNAGTTAGEVGDLNAELGDIGSSGNVSGIKKVDTAFQSLMDTLFPAEAAQRKYNEQLVQLRSRLQGDQLAKAIDRLTQAFTGGDADGPADAIKAYREELDRLEDKINPAGRAAREFREEQAKLRAEIERSGDPTGKWTRLLEENERQMRENTRVTNQWTEWTESALERVDSAFADAWRNIGDGFSSFRDNLTNAFKQMLAELAHMAITRPIIMQFGSMMGIGGGTQGQNGIWGSLLGGGSGGGSGGLNLGSLLQFGQSAYGVFTGVGPAAMAGWQSGGIGGALNGIGSYYGGMIGNAASAIGGWFGGGAASSAASGTGYGIGQSLVSGQIGSAAYAGASAGASSGASGVLSGITGMLTNPVTWIAAGMLASNKLYSDGVRADGSAIRAQYSDSGSSGAAKALGGITSIVADITKWTDKAMDPAGIFGRAVPIITGSPLTQAVNMGIARLFGGGERFKRTVGSATGYYGDDGYVGTGVDGSFYGGSRRFGDEFDSTLDSINERFVTAMGGLFEAFDVDSSISTTLQTRLRRTSGRLAASFFTEIDGQLTSFGRQYSKDGKLGEAMEQFADDIMGEYFAKTIVGSDLPEYFRQQFEPLVADSKVTAEQVAETLTEIFARFDGVNHVLELTRLAAFELTDAGMRASDAIIALSGGLDALQASTSVYYDQFFSAAEKQADTIAAVEKAFAAADITLADSREAYRAMVEDIDVTTAHGQQMFATMMGLAGQAAQYYDILDARAAQSIAMLGAGLDASLGALQRSIAAQQKRLQDAHAARIGSLNDMAATASSSISALTSISNSLDAAVKRLRGTSDDATRSLRAQAVMTLNSALVSARSGQSLAGFDGLQDALDVASQMDTALYSSLVDFEREQGRTANLIAELEKVNGKQLSAEERLLQLVQDQISAAERQFESEMAGLSMQLAYAQSQVDALNGIDNSIMGVASAVAAMNASVVAALKGLPRGSAQANTPANNLSIVDTAYRTVLGREVDASGREYWSDRLQSGSLEYSDFAETLARAALQNPTEGMNNKSSALEYLRAQGVPGFASGGVFGGGLRLVGEQGPELEVTGPSRIYSASQTAAMMQGGNSAETVAELRQLRNEIHDGLRSIAKHTMKAARNSEYLERWDYDGLPQEREAI